MLLFKDAIRLFAAYNEGIINLLGKYNCFVQSSAELLPQFTITKNCGFGIFFFWESLKI